MFGGQDPSWLWGMGLIGFAFGIVVGGGAVALFMNGKSRARRLQQELDRLQAELDNYRTQVTQHFLRTSELVQNLTRSYREVYDHLASGSQQLCKDRVATPRLDLPEAGVLPPTPTAEAQDSALSEDFSDAETDSSESAALEEYLGEAPQVPELDPTPAQSDNGGRSTPS